MDARAGIDLRLAAQVPAAVPADRKTWFLNVSARRQGTLYGVFRAMPAGENSYEIVSVCAYIPTLDWIVV